MREVRYRIRDNYVRFYLKFIEPHRKSGENRYIDFLVPVERLFGA